MSQKTEKLTKRRAASVPQGPFNVTPLFAARAEGSVITDVDGREFIDFAGGIGVINTGHRHPKVVAAIKDQAERYIHTCFHVVMYEPYLELAERLCSLTPGNFSKMTLFANSGAEAVENAVKAARYHTRRPAVIALEHAFHGRTLLGMSLTGKVMPYKSGFGPFAPEIYRMPAPYCYRCSFGLEYPSCGLACAEHLHELFRTHVAAESTAALIAEPILGEGGFITPPPEYFPALARICKENGIVLIADEVQSGMGRTGTMFATQHWGVEPDLITSAKSLAAGMPLSAVIGRQEILNAAHVGGLGGTYGGNPICLRAALAVLDVFEEENLLDRARSLGRTLRARLDSMAERRSLVGEVRGLGPMLALELVRDKKTKEPAAEETKELIRYAYQNGLVILSCGGYGNVIRLLMPLNIAEEQLNRGLEILDKGLGQVGK